MNLILCIFLAGALGYLAVYYASVPLTFLFMAQVAIPLLALIPALISALGTRVALAPAPELWAMGDALYLQALRRGPFPFPHLRVGVRIRCQTADKLQVCVVRLPPATGKSLQGRIPFNPPGCGLYKISLKSCRGSDYLRVFPLPVSYSRQETELYVLPNIYNTPIRLSDYTRAFVPEGEHYHKGKSGGDYSETFGVRPYRPGDKLSRVHWKLSAKSDDYIIRQGSLPIGNSVVLFIDTAFLGSRLWDTVFSISAGLIQIACSHYLCWLTGQGQLQRAVIGQLSDLYDLVPQLFALAPGRQALPIEESYSRIYPGETYAVALRVADGIYAGGRRLPGSENPEQFLPQNGLVL